MMRPWLNKLTMFCLWCVPLVVYALPSFNEVKAGYNTSESVLFDRHGAVIQTLRTDFKVRRFDWTSLQDVSPALRTALVLSEDQRFYEHSGVDWKSVGASAWANLWNNKTRGASTITMQLAGLIDTVLRNTSTGRSWGQKIGQAATALSLERSWKKDQVLEAYLNLVGYRGELVGIAALSATLFEKFPNGLNAREAAITAALVRAPNAKPNMVADRACGILKAQKLDMECLGLRDYTALVLTKKAAVRLDKETQLAPHLARKLATQGMTPRRLVTSLDSRLQRFARDSLRQHLAELANRNVEDGAVLVLDNATGEVLAWVGSSGDLSDAAEVDGVLASRQAGSTLKPFLYELAIEKRWLTAASILDDTPVNLHTAAGLYIPQNYDNDFKGPVSVRTALASSLNIPAVRTLVMVTPDRFAERLKALGFNTLKESGDYYGYSLALGSAEVNLATLTNAYRALANHGRWSAIKTSPTSSPVLTRTVMDSAASFIVTDILADPNARALTFGLDSVLSGRTWSAVKTGTSKDMRDNWCIGFSKRYTVGVWVGNASGASMWDVSGTTGAAPVWQAVMHELERGDTDFNRIKTAKSALPRAIIRQSIRFEHELETTRNEYFLPGTEQAFIALSQPESKTTRVITLPIDGSIIALDPDIPPRNQRLRLSATHDGIWKLDGKIIGRSTVIQWPLWPGKHRLELLDTKGALLDTLQFEVRGAEVKTRKLALR